MLVIAAIWIVKFLVFSAFGHLISKILKLENRHWFYTLMLGFCGTMLLASLVHFYIPLDYYFHTAILIFALVIWLINYNRLKAIFSLKINSNYVYYLTIIIIYLMLTSLLPNHGDSDFYHAQALQWAEKHKAPIGLANLFGRLGFNSMFFNTQAAFSLQGFSGVSSRFLNGFLLCCFSIFLFQNLVKKQSQLLAFCFLIFTLIVGRGWVSSIAPDVAVALLLLVVIYFLFMQIFYNQTSNTGVVIILFVSAVCIKVSALLFSPVLLYYLYSQKYFSWRVFGFSFAIGLVWLVSNYINSGYIIYPYLAFPIATSWQVPHELAMIEKNWISAWAKLPSTEWQLVEKLSIFEWFPIWVKAQNMFNKLILLGIFISIISLVVKLFLRKKTNKVQYSLAFIWLCCILFWLFLAPDFRFAYALILPFLLYIALFLLPIKLFQLKNYTYLKPLYLIAFIGFGFYIINKQNIIFLENIIKPTPYKDVKINNIRINNFRINLPMDSCNCNNAPIPCVNENLLSPTLKMRGYELYYGFEQ